MRKLALFAMLPLLSGCVVGTVAKTAFDVATVPVKVASAGVDAVTTSQAEADQKRGRELRQREERLGKLQREYDSLTKKCSDGDRNACQEQQRVYAEIQLILPTVPVDASDPRYH